MKNNFFHWFAGFTDGEGYFGVSPQNNPKGVYYVPQFSIKVRDDDIEILWKIKETLGIGGVFTPPSQKRQAKFQVTSIPQCLKLIEVFDKYPLRAKKKRDYAIWRKIVFALKDGGTTASKIDRKVLDLIVDLKAVKKYST